MRCRHCGCDVEVHLVSAALSHCVRHGKVGLAPPDLHTQGQAYVKGIYLDYTNGNNCPTAVQMQMSLGS